MRSAFLALAATMLFCSAGCQHYNTCQSCDPCKGGHGLAGQGLLGQGLAGRGFGGYGGGLAGHGHGHGHGHAARPATVGHLPPGYMQEMGPTGPPTASYAYPYYTTRAPRDFLQDNPMGIGP